MHYPVIAAARVEQLLAALDLSPPSMPEWYCRRWHFHPDGYLSRSGVRWYDRVIRRLYNWPSEGAIHRYLARLAVDAGATSILDAGCGTGRLLAEFARLEGTQELVGIDLSPVMLQRARSVVRPASAQLLRRDLAAQDWPKAADAPFDLVVLMHVLGHLPGDIADLVAERAIAAAGERGVVAVVDHTWHPAPAALTALAIRQRRRFRAGMITVTVYGRTAPAARVP